MATKKELEQKQNQLDQEELECPKCGQIEYWKTYREFGCEKEFIKYMEEKDEKV